VFKDTQVSKYDSRSPSLGRVVDIFGNVINCVGFNNAVDENMLGCIFSSVRLPHCFISTAVSLCLCVCDWLSYYPCIKVVSLFNEMRGLTCKGVVACW
jgi:hypothetical protein